MKRIFDVLTIIIALPVIVVLFIITAILVRIKLGKPILFRQIRPGLHGKPFKMLKFRTMTDERDSHGNLLPDEKRLTKFGIFLRSTSLDELPEIFSVVRLKCIIKANK